MKMDVESDLTLKHTKLPECLRELLDIEEEVTLVYGQKKPQLCESSVLNDGNTSQCNLTGTPLEVDLDTGMSVPVRDNRRHRNDKWFMPIKLNRARTCINNHNKTIKGKKGNHIIVCICDATDKQGVIAIASSISDRWFNRTLVCGYQTVPLNYIKKNFQYMHDCHVKNCAVESPKVETKITCSYAFYGYHLTDHDLENDISNTGSILLGCSWNSLNPNIPQHGAEISLTLQVILGHQSSSAFHLYQDLEFLQSCLTELSNINTKPTRRMSLNPKEDHEVYNNVKEILHSVHSIKICNDETNPFEIDNDLNFTDKLWNILKYCENIDTLQRCFKIVFDTIENENLKIQILEDDKNSIIGKAIENIFANKMLIPHLSEKQCLEILLELGMQKLKKSYLKIIKFYDLKIAKEYQDKWNTLSVAKEQARTIFTELSVPQEIAKAQFLFHTHILIEFLQLLKGKRSTFSLAKQVIRPMYEKFLKGPMPDTFFNIKTKRLCDITVVLPFSDVTTLANSNGLCDWKMKLRTHSNVSSVVTTFCFSKKPIIPNAGYIEDNLDQTTNENMYAIRVESYSDKCC